MGASEVTCFLSWLATDAKVSASTQNQALAALLSLYREVLSVDLPWLADMVRAKGPAPQTCSHYCRRTGMMTRLQEPWAYAGLRCIPSQDSSVARYVGSPV